MILTCLLYAFQGAVKVNESIDLRKKEGLIFNENLVIGASTDAELVLFLTD